MRRSYRMTQEQYDKLIKACTPAPLIMMQCGTPPSVQESVNAAWVALGKEMGFDGMTAAMVNNDKFCFTAEKIKGLDLIDDEEVINDKSN